MTRIRVENGEIIVPSDPCLELPEELSEEFFILVFEALPYEDHHVARIHERLPWTEKERFRQACSALGTEFQAALAQAEISWACVINENNQWDPKTFNFCYRQRINSHLIDEILLTETGLWFVQNSEFGLMSEEEFYFHFGVDFNEHLDKWEEFVGQLVRRVKEIMSDELVAKDVTLSTTEGIQTTTRVGPQSVDARFWCYPAGSTYLDG